MLPPCTCRRTPPVSPRVRTPNGTCPRHEHPFRRKAGTFPSTSAPDHCLNSSGLVHASNTRRAGPLKVRVTTSSRSNFRSIGRAGLHGGQLTLSSCVHLASPSVSVPRQRCPARRSVRPRAGGTSRSMPPPPASRHRPSLQVRTRPTFSVVTSPACSRTPTCFFMPVRVMWNLSARSVIEAFCTAELLQNAASGGVRERGERGIEGSRVY